jgi:hypothetical protein
MVIGLARGPVSGLWRDNQLERLMAQNGDVKKPGCCTKPRNKKQRERETGTKPCKNAVEINKAVTAITWAPIKD